MKNIVGGPSIVFTRGQVKKKRPKSEEKKEIIVSKNQGNDCNSLYLWAIGLPQYTRPYCLRERSRNFQNHSKDCNDKKFLKYSQKTINWLESIERKRGIKIQHAENHHSKTSILMDIGKNIF